MAADHFTQFDYLLNAMKLAAQQEKPAEHGYGWKRQRLYAHVRELERKADLYDAEHKAGPCAANNLDSIALEAAQEIALMWGRDRTQFVAKIQVAVRDAMERAHGVQATEEAQQPCPVCGGTERNRAGYLLCECPAASLKPAAGVAPSDGGQQK